MDKEDREDREELNLDSKMLLPIKTNLESVINRLMYSVIKEDKEAEINLKIQIEKITKEKLYKEINFIDKWIEPRFSYSISEKIKEHKETNKGIVGFDFAIGYENDRFLVEEINKQESLFDEEKAEKRES